jgi:ABC-type sugar transport system substrate-binding protein
MERTGRNVHLKFLTKQAQRKQVDRRDFMKGAMALGLSAGAALLLFQACGGDEATAVPPTATTAAPVQVAEPGAPEATAPPEVSGEENLDWMVKRFPPLETLPFKADEMWEFPDGHTVIYLANDLAHPYTLSSSNIFKEEAEQRLHMTYAVLDSAGDLNKEQDNFDQAIAGEYDVIIYHALDTTSGGANIDRARRAGQIVMAYAENTLVRPTARWAKNTYQEGQVTAQWLGEQLGTGAKVAGAVGDLVSHTGQARQAGFMEGAAQAGLEVVAFEEGTGWTQEGGYTVGEAMLSNLADVQGIFGGDDLGALGIHRAAVDAGRRDGLLITGVDGFKAGQDGVADGSLDMSVMIRAGHGPEAIRAMDFVEAMIRGGPIHGDSAWFSMGMKLRVVTAANIAEQWKSPV